MIVNGEAYTLPRRVISQSLRCPPATWARACSTIVGFAIDSSPGRIDSTIRIFGSDVAGIIVGTLDAAATTLDLAYQGSATTLLACHFVMTKK